MDYLSEAEWIVFQHLIEHTPTRSEIEEVKNNGGGPDALEDKRAIPSTLPFHLAQFIKDYGNGPEDYKPPAQKEVSLRCLADFGL